MATNEIKMVQLKLQVPTTIYKSNGLPKKKKATSKKATPSPKKTDEKLKPKTKENKQMTIFFYFYLTYQH